MATAVENRDTRVRDKQQSAPKVDDKKRTDLRAAANKNEGRPDALKRADGQQGKDRIAPTRTAELKQDNSRVEKAAVDKPKKAEEERNPAAPLADVKQTPEKMQAYLRNQTTPQLTKVLKATDSKDMGFGDKITPTGRKALEGEIAKRFDDAKKNQDYNNPDLARLSKEVVRHNNTPGARYAERSWRQQARPMSSIDSRKGDAKAAETNKILNESNRLVQHRINGSTPPSEMTNRQLLNKAGGLKTMQAGADIIGLTGVGMIAPFMAESKAKAVRDEVGKRMTDGRLPEGSMPKEHDGSAANAAGFAVLAGQVAAAISPKNWIKKGVQKIGGLFKKKATTAADDVAKSATRVPSADDAAKLLGTSKRVGDFTGLAGKSIDDVLGRIPKNATRRELKPVEGKVTEGFEYKWKADGKTHRVRIHGPDASRPATDNAGAGWTFRVQKGSQFMDESGTLRHAQVHNPRSPNYDAAAANGTHIRLQGNPLAKVD